MQSVAPGEARFPVLSAASDGAYKAKSASTTPVAATLTTEKLNPIRATVAYEYAREEKYQWGADALESALRADMRAALTEMVDNALINGTGSGQPQGILAGVTATPAGDPTTTADFGAYIEEAIGAIDGRYARDESGIRWLLNPESLRVIRATYATNTAVNALADLRASGVSITSSALMPNTASNIAKAIRLTDPAGVVLPVWQAFELVRNEFGGGDGDKAEIRIDAHLFLNCRVIRSAGIAHRKMKIT